MQNAIKFLQYHIQNAPDALYEIVSWLIETEGDVNYTDYVSKCQVFNVDPMSPTLYKECKLGEKTSYKSQDDDWHVGDIIY
jgi:hypothetical protein